MEESLQARFRPLTLATFEAAVLSAGGDPDDVLFGRDEVPGEAVFSPGTFLHEALGADGEALPEGAFRLLLPRLTEIYVAHARAAVTDALLVAAFYADRCGIPLGGSEGSGISLARLCAREGVEGAHRLRTMPLADALQYLLVRGVDHASETFGKPT